MRVVVAHHVADDLGALAVLGVGRQVLLPHRVEDAALHRLQAVAHVGQGARGDDRQRVVQVARLRRLVERHGRVAPAGRSRQDVRLVGESNRDGDFDVFRRLATEKILVPGASGCVEVRSLASRWCPIGAPRSRGSNGERLRPAGIDPGPAMARSTGGNRLSPDSLARGRQSLAHVRKHVSVGRTRDDVAHLAGPELTPPTSGCSSMSMPRGLTNVLPTRAAK